MSVPEKATLSYAGFWVRFFASIVDSILSMFILLPILVWAYGLEYFTADKWFHGPVDVIVNWVLPPVATIIFWVYRQATPGKMVLGARILDAKTGNKPTTGQLIGRYFAYYVSMLGFFLGFVWVAFDRRKQGWHDKLAGTVVVMAERT